MKHFTQDAQGYQDYVYLWLEFTEQLMIEPKD